MKKSKMPKPSLKKNPYKDTSVHNIHPGRWPYKFVIWHINPESEDSRVYGLMDVKYLAVRDVKTEKILMKIVYDYRSDEGSLGKKKSVQELFDKESDKDEILISIEMAEEILEAMIQMMKNATSF